MDYEEMQLHEDILVNFLSDLLNNLFVYAPLV